MPSEVEMQPLIQGRGASSRYVEKPVTAVVMDAEQRGPILAGDRIGFEQTIHNCNKQNIGDDFEEIPQFDPESYSDFDMCYVFPNEPKKGEKMMTVEEIEKAVLKICRARYGQNVEQFNDVKSLHPIYHLEGKLDKPMTVKQFHELIILAFYRVLQHIGATFVKEQGYDKNAMNFIRARLSEEACKVVADFKSYPLQLDRYVTRYEEFRQDPLFSAPYLNYEKHIEERADKVGAMRTLGKVWARYDRLGRCVQDPEVNPNSPELSVFRDIDRMRLLHQAVFEFINVDYLLKKKYMKCTYPLKQKAKERALRKEWSAFSKVLSVSQPLDAVRAYYGEEIAMYFAWIGFYSAQLTVPSIIGVVLTFLVLMFDKDFAYDIPWLNHARMAYCIFAGAWVTYFYQSWRQKEKLLVLRWGTQCSGGPRSHEEYSGFEPDSFIVDPVQPDKYMKYYSSTKRRMREALTGTVLIVCTLCAVITVNDDLSQGLASWMGYPQAESFGNALLDESGGEHYVSRALFLVCSSSIMIKVFDKMWSKKIAYLLADFENHQYLSQWSNSVNFKLFFFKIVDYFAMLFYLAFFKEYFQPCDDSPDGRCLKSLRRQLIALVVVELSGNIKEIAMPFVKYMLKSKMSKAEKDMPEYQKEANLEAYTKGKGLTGDYLDQMINFGFTTLFSLVLPVLPLISQVVNFVEIRTDAFKLTNALQRPYPRGGENIGVWNDVQGAISFLGILSNVALCAFATMGYNHGLAYRLFWCLVLMLSALGVKELIEFQFPTESGAYKIAAARHEAVEYEALWGDRDISEFSTQLRSAPSMKASQSRRMETREY